MCIRDSNNSIIKKREVFFLQTGKSLIKFIVIIAILMGLILWGIQIIVKEADKKELETIHTNMLQVQAKAKVVFEKYHVENANGLKGRKIENNSELESFGINDDGNYYICLLYTSN